MVAGFRAALSAAGLSDDACVLDLGTGTAQIPLELCRQNPRVRVVAIDLAEEMLRLAAQNIERAGFAFDSLLTTDDLGIVKD